MQTETRKIPLFLNENTCLTKQEIEFIKNLNHVFVIYDDIKKKQKNRQNQAFFAQFCLFLVEATGFAPLAARPSGRLSIVQFCNHLFVPQQFKAKQLFSRKVLPTLEPRRKPQKQKNPKMETPFLDFWSRRRGSNPRPQRPERCALPAALRLVLSFKRTYYNKCAFNCQSFLCA